VATNQPGACTDLVDPHPYWEPDVPETQDHLDGMEYSESVVVEDGLCPAVSTVEWSTAHEVTRQWWMIVAGNDHANKS